MDQRHFKSETIKLIENLSVHPCDLGFDNEFLDRIVKEQATKEKKKVRLHKIKIFCASKNIMKEIKIHKMGENIYKQYI